MRHAGNTSILLNTEVKQYWARIVFGWVTIWELLVLLTKPKPVSTAEAFQPSRCVAKILSR